MTAVHTPSTPVLSEPLTVTLNIRNDGKHTVSDVRLTDDVSASAAVRSASTVDGTCTVTGRQVVCVLPSLTPGQVRAVEVRLLVEAEPANSTIVQRIKLSGGGAGDVAVLDQSVSALLASGESPSRQLLELPGPTVTLVAFVGFVLAARGGAR